MKLTKENLKDFGVIPKGDVIIPDGITEIGDGAFWRCYDLRSVTIPNTVTVIGREAFKECKKLKHIDLPSSLVAIGSSAFEDCDLEFVKIPASIKRLGACIFSDCRHLKTIELPNTLQRIPPSFAARCIELEHIEIPDSVTEIGDSAFCECGLSGSVKLPVSLKRICSGAFDMCCCLESIKIPDSVTEIGVYAFCCPDLVIEVPSTVTGIREDAFYVKQVIHLDPEECADQIILNRDDIAKYHISTTGEITIPQKVRDSDGNWHEVLGIGTGAFYNCKDLEIVRFPDRIAIATGAFMGCINAVIHVPASALVADHAFDDVAHITYHGNLPGAPWGANSMN